MSKYLLDAWASRERRGTLMNTNNVNLSRSSPEFHYTATRAQRRLTLCHYINLDMMTYRWIPFNFSILLCLTRRLWLFFPTWVQYHFLNKYIHYVSLTQLSLSHRLLCFRSSSSTPFCHVSCFCLWYCFLVFWFIAMPLRVLLLLMISIKLLWNSSRQSRLRSVSMSYGRSSISSSSVPSLSHVFLLHFHVICVPLCLSFKCLVLHIPVWDNRDLIQKIYMMTCDVLQFVFLLTTDFSSSGDLTQHWWTIDPA